MPESRLPRCIIVAQIAVTDLFLYLVYVLSLSTSGVRMVRGFLVLALAAFVQWSGVSGSNIRGLAPDLRQKYSNSKGEFACFDGVGVVPFDAVNDDYCDCQDGSDEPGTSACGNGEFYCENIGHQPRILASQFVDDGICDCCDGSDEIEGCGNTCAELGAELKADIEKRLKVVETGLKTKEARIAEGLTLRKSWEEEIVRITGEVEKQKEVVEKLRVEKIEADRIEREEAERQQALEDSLKTNETSGDDAETGETEKRDTENAENTGNPGAGDEGESGTLGNTGEGVQDSDEAEEGWSEAVKASAQHMEQKEVSGEQEPDSASHSAQANAESDMEKSVENSVDVESKEEESFGGAQVVPESQLGGDSDVEVLDEDEQDDIDAVTYDAEDAYEMDPKDYDEADNEDPSSPPDSTSHGFMERVSSLANRVKDSMFGKSSGGTKASQSRPKVKTQEQSAISQQLNKAESELRSLESKLKDLNDKMTRDHGPSGEYTSLDGRCVDVQVGKYGYEMCPFGEAKQTEGGGSTGLGSWHGFDEAYKWMSFSRGRKCWSGPARSLNLQLQCGEADEIMNVEEPNMCEYVGIFKTPAFCNQEEAEFLRVQLEQLGGLSQERKDEL
ncbi:hypothetical protein BSKO_00067 [Bryopsis sp. KO-2023]|nr:hypothetical protein BSKO_00067 [Bryopsis sp. KO-2023]